MKIFGKTYPLFQGALSLNATVSTGPCSATLTATSVNSDCRLFGICGQWPLAFLGAPSAGWQMGRVHREPNDPTPAVPQAVRPEQRATGPERGARPEDGSRGWCDDVEADERLVEIAIVAADGTLRKEWITAEELEFLAEYRRHTLVSSVSDEEEQVQGER